MRKSTICQLRTKIIKLMSVLTNATRGVAVCRPSNMARKGMATKASPNPRVERVKVEKNRTQRVAAAMAVACMIGSFISNRAVSKDSMHALYDRIDASARQASIPKWIYILLALMTAVVPGLALTL